MALAHAGVPPRLIVPPASALPASNISRVSLAQGAL
jgi:hypothetical protein